MRYPFRPIAGMPSVPSVGFSVVLANPPALGAGSPSEGGVAIAAVDVSVSSTPATIAATISVAANIVFVFTNAGAVDASGAVLTLPWLADSAARTFGAASVVVAGGATTATPSNAAIQSGLSITAFPPGATVTITVAVTTVSAFSEVLIGTLAPPSGVPDLAPVNNSKAVLLTSAAAAPSVKWQQWSSSTLAASVTVGVAEKRFSPDIRFCGDDYTQWYRFGGYVAVPACPPNTGECSGARWKIKIAGYNAGSTYATVINQSALTPAVPANVFTATRSGDTITIETAYGLLGTTVGDNIAAGGNVTFTVTENGTSIGVCTLVVQAYAATF
jgi:hypothetical protein